LLAHPDRDASVYEVVCGYALGVADQANSGLEHDDIDGGFQVTTGAPLGDAGVVVDRKAVEQYRAKYQSLVTEKAEAEKSRQVLARAASSARRATREKTSGTPSATPSTGRSRPSGSGTSRWPTI